MRVAGSTAFRFSETLRLFALRGPARSSCVRFSENKVLRNSVHMLSKEWTFIKIRAAEFEPRKLCIANRSFLVLLARMLCLTCDNPSCPFKTSHGLRLREAPWSAVAAATAFLVLAVGRLRYEAKAEGGSCCYRTPRRASPAGRAPTSNSDPQDTLGCGSAALRYP